MPSPSILDLAVTLAATAAHPLSDGPEYPGYAAQCGSAQGYYRPEARHVTSPGEPGKPPSLWAWPRLQRRNIRATPSLSISPDRPATTPAAGNRTRPARPPRVQTTPIPGRPPQTRSLVAGRHYAPRTSINTNAARTRGLLIAVTTCEIPPIAQTPPFPGLG